MPTAPPGQNQQHTQRRILQSPMKPLDRIRENLTETLRVLHPDEPDEQALLIARSYITSSLYAIQELLPTAKQRIINPMAQELGSSKSEKKAGTSRENGKKGGRPRKVIS
jgi:hypothetical protein